MGETSGKSFDPATWFNGWMKSATDLWSAVPPSFLSGFAEPRSGDREQGPVGQWLNDQLRTWQSLASALSHPDTLSAGLQGIANLPASLAALVMPMLAAAADMHWKTMDQNARANDLMASFDLENQDKRAIDLWNNVYDQEFRKFLNIPQLGLTRQYQEKINRFMDRVQALQAALAEFLRLLYRPFEKAQADYAKKLAQDLENKEMPKDARSQYMVWLKILEGHYMVLFKTPEYLSCLSKTISAAAEYSLARKALMEDVLKTLSIPSPEALDGVYRDLHDMKKRLRALEKTIQKVSP